MTPVVFTLERLAPPARALLRAVQSAAGRSRSPMLVGGAVRDTHRESARRAGPADLDIAVESGALELAARVAARLGGAFVLLDPERGAARVLARGMCLDVTDWRAPTLEDDLAARDFTVNALAVSVRELLSRGRAGIVDPTGGLADLRARRLRVHDPRVLTEDPLRTLRGVRLEAALGFRLTAKTARAIRSAGPALAGVAAERVRDELLALLALPRAARALRRLDALGLLRVIVPEVEAMRSSTQPAPRRLVDGRIRFFEHDVRGAARARDIAERLRLPARARGVLERLVRHHLRPGHLAAAGGVTPRARYRFYRDLGEDTRDLLLLTLVDAAAVTGVSPRSVWRRAAVVRDLLRGWEETSRAGAEASPLVRCEDVMARFGIPPGPEVGRLLERAREAQGLGLVTTREEALAYLDSPASEPLE